MMRLPRRSTLFPYTTLFRSLADPRGGGQEHAHLGRETARHYEGHAGADLAGRPGGSGGRLDAGGRARGRSEEHTSELQSLTNLVCRLLLEKKNNTHILIH